jgi:two-component system, chemotaxis family, CheB/CheR fusion protein
VEGVSAVKKAKPASGRKHQRNAAAGRAAAVPAGEKKVQKNRSFPIIGLGASAGGLEALEQFLKHVPGECGLGFVVVQHLDPTHKGMLVELLQRNTSMEVLQIKDRMKVEPNRVYVIPPNRDLSILNGVLHLLEPAAPRGLRLPIDFFFRSLADDRQERSIGVILSGMGSDGTLGLRAIKEKAGAVFVQTPASAKFDSMPRMAIDAGLADVVAPAEELPRKIIDYLQHVPLLVRQDRPIAEKDQSALEKIILLLRGQSGHDFSLYKKSTISRRVERRMGLHQIARIADYVRYLRENSQESDLLFKELLIGVTSFFRDPGVWDQLKNKIIPNFLATRPGGGVLRAWTAGCSTGEEAYSLAIVFKEALGKIKPPKNFSLQIFATDLDKDAIDKARAGVYPPNIGADVSEKRLREFFVAEENGSYRVRKEIREMIIFAPQNLVMHPPFTKLDFVTCRNLLIYLDTDLQKKLMPLFHYSLNPGGILLLGSAETIGTATDLFTPLESKSRIYRRLDTSRQANLVEFPSAFSRTRANVAATAAAPAAPISPAPNLQSLADQLLLQRYSPAAVLVTNEGDILYVSGKTGKYLEPAAGKANWNLFAMSREGLGNALSEAFHQAVRKKIVITLKNVKVGTNENAQTVDITVQPVTGPDALRGMVMVVFTDVAKLSTAKPPGASERTTLHHARLGAMARELRQAHEDLQVTRDEMQSSQEELKSTNEELQSMNEELQSTNEELTTSKEEMQSMNEELQTVNHELQSKVDELYRASNDMKNLLNSTDIATLFLDDALLVRRFTTQTTKIIKLIPGDVGRPITDIVTTLDYPRLAKDAHQVLKTLAFVEKQISAPRGHWYTVRIMPYRTQDNRIDGVVITFADITVAKNLEAALRKAQSDLEKRFTSQKVELGKARKIRRTTRPAK